MTIRLHNEWLDVEIASRGAELQSVRSRRTGLEYLWQGDPRWWDRRAPVLFPIVGHLKSSRYLHDGKLFRLPVHGFAADGEFTIRSTGDDHLDARLAWNTETFRLWPFRFELRIGYRLEGPSLHQSYSVQNVGDHDLWFSIGFHPGFRCPLLPGERFTDYRIRFPLPESLARQEIRRGLRTGRQTPLLESCTELPLDKGLFDSGAIVLKGPVSPHVDLVNPRTGNGIRCGTAGFPWLGLWTQGEGEFLCIEPWNGVTGRIEGDERLEARDGMMGLPPGTSRKGGFAISPLLP